MKHFHPNDSSVKTFDVLILGAGASGLMCAGEAAKRGRRVAILDHADEIGHKIRISGGGHCNFTNRNVSADDYRSENPHFVKSALSRFTPEDFLDRVREQGILFFEKNPGELFCSGSAKQIVAMLEKSCVDNGAAFFLGHSLRKIKKEETFVVETNHGTFTGRALVVATGGLSYPKIGATGIGYDLAKQFGHKTIPTAPALDGFVLAKKDISIFDGLAGISFESVLTAGGKTVRGSTLVTHTGLSGPAALTASLHWEKGKPLRINFIPNPPEGNLLEWFLKMKNVPGRRFVSDLLSEILSKRLADRLEERFLPEKKPLAELSKPAIENLCKHLTGHELIPAGTVGYDAAEATRGGVDTREISSQTMESKIVPGLYFTGEVLDVTGRLGGFNLQWAWSSGWAAGQSV